MIELENRWGMGKTNVCISDVEKENQRNLIEQILKDRTYRNVLVAKSF